MTGVNGNSLLAWEQRPDEHPKYGKAKRGCFGKENVGPVPPQKELAFHAAAADLIQTMFARAYCEAASKRGLYNVGEPTVPTVPTATPDRTTMCCSACMSPMAKGKRRLDD